MTDRLISTVRSTLLLTLLTGLAIIGPSATAHGESNPAQLRAKANELLELAERLLRCLAAESAWPARGRLARPATGIGTPQHDRS